MVNTEPGREPRKVARSLLLSVRPCRQRLSSVSAKSFFDFWHSRLNMTVHMTQKMQNNTTPATARPGTIDMRMVPIDQTAAKTITLT